nr:uncharacterized protein LOC113740785 [Coffea arabica]
MEHRIATGVASDGVGAPSPDGYLVSGLGRCDGLGGVSIGALHSEGWEESVIHLFLGGPVAERVWAFFRGRFGILRPNSQPKIRPVLRGLRWDPQGIISAVGSAVEQLGRAKVLSMAHFKGDSGDPWAHLATWRSQVMRHLVISWLPSPEGVVKLNTDASVTRGRVSGGGLLRDHEGRLIFAFYKEFGEVDVLTAESSALLQGLLFCTGVRIQQLLVEVDSAGLVHLLDSGALAKWPLCRLIRQIRALLQSFNTTAKHIFREANSAADKLATMDR